MGQFLPVSISVIASGLVGCGGLCPVRCDNTEPGACGSLSQNPTPARLGNPLPPDLGGRDVCPPAEL